MAQIYSIAAAKRNVEYRSPEYFVNQVLNDPARLERVKAKREAEIRKSQEKAKQEAQKAADEKRMNEWAMKVSFGIMLFITFASTLVALLN